MGALTGIPISNQPFIQGYETTGLCIGDPITGPITVSIDATNYINQNCQNTNVSLDFNYCGTSVQIPFSSIASNYPNGTQFYNSYPVTSTTIEYTSSNPFPTAIGDYIYYAIPPNSNQCHYRFTISIADIPTITAPNSSTILGCGTAAIAPLLYSSTPVTITLQDFINAGGSVSNNTLNYSISYFDQIISSCPTVVTRNFTISTSCITLNLSQSITIENADFTMPANTTATVACAADLTAPTVPTVTDNCGNVLTASAPVVAANPACEGNVTYTYTFTDCEGNTHNWIHTVTIDDTIPPTGIAPADILNLQCASEIPVADINLVSNVADNCSGTVTITVSETNNGGTGCNGSPLIITRTYILTDCSGLSTNLVQTIIVEDNTAPTFTNELPANINVSCDAVPSAQTLTATDNCANDVLITVADSIDSSNSNCAGQYVIIRTWTATDSCNNSVTHSQTITVTDIAAPTIVTPLDAEINVNCSEVPTTPTPEFIDNCSGILDVIHNETINTISIYQYTITHVWTVSDNCGNEANFSQIINVTVEDPFDAIAYSICIEEAPIDLFTILGDSIPTDGTWIEVTTSGGLSGNVFNPENVELGYYTLQYIVNQEDNDCPMIFEIYLNVNDDCVVLAACDITVYNAISPNDDNSNDIMIIDGIECYPNNTVEIYNRWGILVYDERGYDNALKSFKGKSEGRSTLNKNELLPDGTYFYILRYTDEENKNHDKSGYLYLNR